MKKIIALVMLLFAMLMVSGCGELESVLENNMSDIRINFFEGKNENIYANLSCGYREETFSYDGVSATPVECGVLSVSFLNAVSYSSVSVVLIVDGVETEYILEKSPFEDVYMEDIGKILTENNEIKIKLKTSENVVILKEISKNWKINYKKAICIGANFFKEELSELYFNGQLHAEGYLKVASKKDYDKKYWYFSITDQSRNNYTLLIDVENGECISNSKS